MMAEIRGGGPHDGAKIQVPDNCVAIVTVTKLAYREYVASLAVTPEVDLNRLEDCLWQLLEQRTNGRRW